MDIYEFMEMGLLPAPPHPLMGTSGGTSPKYALRIWGRPGEGGVFCNFLLMEQGRDLSILLCNRIVDADVGGIGTAKI